MKDMIVCLMVYFEVGVDCFYVFGVYDLIDIVCIVVVVCLKLVNVMIMGFRLVVFDFVVVGVRWVSIGGFLVVVV